MTLLVLLAALLLATLLLLLARLLLAAALLLTALLLLARFLVRILIHGSFLFPILVRSAISITRVPWQESIR
ncbi:MAG: hypothetical protein ACM3IH_16435 [Sphingobacteriales bacterium]